MNVEKFRQFKETCDVDVLADSIDSDTFYQIRDMFSKLRIDYELLVAIQSFNDDLFRLMYNRFVVKEYKIKRVPILIKEVQGIPKT